MAKTTDYKKIETRDLVEMFADAAAGRGRALRAANPKEANTGYKLMIRLYREIRIRGTKGQLEMLPLLQNENRDVRASAACLVLEFDAQAAEPILEQIHREEHNLLGFTAGMVLKQWKEGKLRFP